MSPAIFVSLRHVKDPGLEAKAQIFEQGDAQVGIALRLLEEVEGAHFRTVVGAGANLGGAGGAELGISRIAINYRSEQRSEADANCRRDCRVCNSSESEVRLAMKAARGSR